MTTIHIHEVGEQAIVPRQELERLLELARRVETVEISVNNDDVTTKELVQLAEGAHAFAWLADEPDIYSVDDLRERFR